MPNHFAFIDESGVLDVSQVEQPFFGIGLLRIEDPGPITEELARRHYDFSSVQKAKRRALLIELTKRPRAVSADEINGMLMATKHHEYKFTHLTPLNLNKYEKVLDTALGFPIHFCALVIDKTDPLFNSQLYKNYWSAYIRYSQVLCEHNSNAINKISIVADYMNKPNDSEAFFEHELNRVPNVLNVLRAHSESFTLLQVCDLLLGAVLFEWRAKKGLIKRSNRAAAKMDFVNYLVSKLKISPGQMCQYPLAQAITINRPAYFSVWPLKLS